MRRSARDSECVCAHVRVCHTPWHRAHTRRLAVHEPGSRGGGRGIKVRRNLLQPGHVALITAARGCGPRGPLRTVATPGAAATVRLTADEAARNGAERATGAAGAPRERRQRAQGATAIATGNCAAAYTTPLLPPHDTTRSSSSSALRHGRLTREQIHHSDTVGQARHDARHVPRAIQRLAHAIQAPGSVPHTSDAATATTTTTSTTAAAASRCGASARRQRANEAARAATEAITGPLPQGANVVTQQRALYTVQEEQPELMRRDKRNSGRQRNRQRVS